MESYPLIIDLKLILIIIKGEIKMKNKATKIMSLVLSLVLLLSFTITSYAQNKSIKSNDFSNIIFTDAIGEVLIEDEIVNITKNDRDIIEIEGEKDGIISKVKINKITGKITAKTIDKNKNENDYNITVIIENKEEGRYTSTFENITTKEKYEIKSKDKDKLQGSAWILIPVGIGLVDIIVGGVLVGTCVAVTIKIGNNIGEIVTDKVQAKIKSNTATYYPAKAKGDFVYYVSSKPMSLSQATLYVAVGGDVMCKDYSSAKLLTGTLGGPLRKAENHDESKPGYFWHFHPKSSPRSHIWYVN